MRAVLLATVFLVALPCVARTADGTQVHYVMGTYLRLTAEGDGAAAGMRDCFRVARQVDQVFSRWSASSELSGLHVGAQDVSDDLARLLARALALGDATDGAFDVRVGPLTELWRRRAIPPPRAIATARRMAAREGVLLDGDRLTLAPGARLDFDGIAKGWAVDACVERLRSSGVRAALVSLGESSLFALGHPAGASRWEVVVRGPDPDTIVGWLGLRDTGASVSASYGSEGHRPGLPAHVIDPRSGRPVRDDAVAVVVAPSATTAEAWTKALLVYGPRGVARAHAAGAIAAVHVGRDAITARVDGPAATWKPLPSPQVLAAREEPLR